MAGAYRLCWSEAALQDLEAILDYICARDGLEAATRVHDTLLGKIEPLVDHPERCSVVPELRELGLTAFRELIVRPYRVCNRVHGRDVVLVSVLDGRRDLEQVLLERAMRR
jgi:plasmid stabilization system protein ParE